MNRVNLYAVGIVSASACAPKDMPLEDVTDEINQRAHPGIGHGWQPSDNPKFSTGEPQPGPCNTDPENRTHYLFNC